MKHTSRDNHRALEALAWIAIVTVGLTGWAGCGDPIPSGATSYELELARAAAATIFAFTPEPAPQPTPPAPPTPEPSVQCSRCNGTGRIKPDGRIEIACPDCDGDGNRGIADFVKLVAGLQSELAELQKAAKPAAPSPPVEPQPATTLTVAEIRWRTSMTVARQEAERSLSPVLLHFYTETCEPCKRMDREVFATPMVRVAISRDFVPCRVDAALLSVEQRREWGVHSVPADVVVTHDWSKRWTLRPTSNANEYERQLTEASTWAATVAEEARAAKQKSVVRQPVTRTE